MASDPRFYELGSAQLTTRAAIYGSREWVEIWPLAEWGKSTRYTPDEDLCPAWEEHGKPSSQHTEPLTLNLPSDRIGDFVWTWLFDCVVTQRVLDLFVDAGLSGYRADPVIVERISRGSKRDLGSLPALWEIRTVATARADPKADIFPVYKCRLCGTTRWSSHKRGLLVDTSTWDGSDFFSLEEHSQYTIITERVKELIVEHALKPCAITPAESVIWDTEADRPERWFLGRELQYNAL